MLLVCPACATEYTVADSVIGPAGRRVRCHRCGHRWQQAGEATASPPAPPIPTQAPMAAPAGAGQLIEARAIATEPAATPRRGSRLVAPPPRRPAVGLWIAWAVLLAIVMGTAAGLILLRETVIAVFPPAERLYAFFESAAAEEPGFGVDIRNVQSKLENDGSQPILKVTGEVANTSGKVRGVPRLRVALADEKGREIRHWYVAAPKLTLAPAEAASFATALGNPPEAARSLKVTFLVEP